MTAYAVTADRLELCDSFLSAIKTLSEGNPGAITALMKMAQEAASIDPDSAWGSLGPLFALDMMGIYGSRIWLFWIDVCGMDAVKANTLFRCVQLGILPSDEVQEAATTGHHRFDFDALLAKVREQVPAFAQTIGAAQ